MRALSAGLLLAVTVATSAAQVPSQSPKPSDELAPLFVNLTPLDPQGGEGATLPVVRNEMYIEGGAIGAGAEPVSNAKQPAAGRFKVTAWKEGDKVRVVVYAVVSDPRVPKGETQTPIKTVALSVGQSVEVSETQAWGAHGFRLLVSTERRAR